VIVTVSGAVVVGGVRYPVQTQVTVPDQREADSGGSKPEKM
jgi:hypothetical protein